MKGKNAMLTKLVDLFFLRACGFCGQKINQRYTCEKCLNILEYYHEKVVLSPAEGWFYDKLICGFDVFNFVIVPSILITSVNFTVVFSGFFFCYTKNCRSIFLRQKGAKENEEKVVIMDVGFALTPFGYAARRFCRG